MRKTLLQLLPLLVFVFIAASIAALLRIHYEALKVPPTPMPGAPGVAGLVIRAGQEAAILELLRAPEQAPSLKLSAVRVNRSVIEADVEPAGVGTLVLAAAGATQSPLLRTTSFDIQWRGDPDWLPAAENHAKAIAARDDGSLWHDLGDRVEATAHETPHHFIHWFVLQLSAGLMASLVLLLPGFRRWTQALDVASTPTTKRAWTLAVAAAGVAVVAALVMLMSARLLVDDYGFLVTLTESPWLADTRLRYLSVTTRFQLLGDPALGVWPFAVGNLITLLAMGGVWALLLVRVGLNTAAALLAGALLTMGPGAYYLMRVGTGFEHLGTYTLLFVCLLLLDLALRSTLERRQAAGLLVLAATLATCGVFMKFHVMFLAPVSAAVWAWLVVPGGRVWKAVGVFALFGVAIALPLAVSLPSTSVPTDVGSASLAGLRLNLNSTVEHLGVAHGRHLLLLGALGLLALVANVGRIPSALRRGLRSPKPRLLLAAIALSVLWLLPFVVNAGHFPLYYPLLMSAPLTAIGAALLVWAASSVPRRLGFVVVAGLLLLLPVPEIRRNLAALDATEIFQDGLLVEHGLTRWHAQLREATAGRTAPEELRLRARCPDDPQLEEQSWRDLDAYSRMGMAGAGVRWETGWITTRVVFEGPGGDASARDGRQASARVDHCRGRPLVLVDAGR